MYESEGEDALASFRIPLLTWRQSEELKAAHRLEAPPGTVFTNTVAKQDR